MADKKRRFTSLDQKTICDYICDEYSKRKRERLHMEKNWKEIDRQIRMEPDRRLKLNENGAPDPTKAWLPETELPLQAECLEVTSADAIRMQLPDSGPWFSPKAALTDKYLNKMDFSAIITGDENKVPSRITQDNVNKLVHGVIEHWHRQYNFSQNLDHINAESIKYGMGVGRGRIVDKSVFLHSAKGVLPLKQSIPVLVPRSIKNTYLDTSKHSLQNEGYVINGGVIFEMTKSLKDLQVAAKKGSTDPNDFQGGWMPGNIKKLKGNDNGNVEILEYEGDLVIPRATTETMFLPNVIMTIVVGGEGRELVRVRFNKYPFSSYLEFPYSIENIDSPYSSSPCMKGYPIQVAAVDALNSLFESTKLRNDPPISYDKDDQEFAQSGGPRVYPGAAWATLGEIQVHEIGDPSGMFAIYQGLLQQYSDVTGITAPRLGAQTVSHTTAFAKEAELSRGTIRTVDYVKSTLRGPLQQWLDMEYQMGRDVMKDTTFYIPSYDGYVTIDKNHLPDTVIFEAHGSGGPAEEAAKQQRRLESLQMAMSMDTMNIQLGGQPKLDLEGAIDQVLKQGGWTDTDAIIRTEQEPAEGAEGGQPMGGVPEGVEGNPTISTALQTLNFGQN